MAKKFRLYLVKTKPEKSERPEKPEKPGFDGIFGERLKTARKRTIYKRIEVADEIGVPKETVRNWERGLAVMPAVYWAPVCEMLYLCPWELMTGACRRTLMPDLPVHLRKVNPRARKA